MNTLEYIPMVHTWVYFSLFDLVLMKYILYIWYIWINMFAPCISNFLFFLDIFLPIDGSLSACCSSLLCCCNVMQFLHCGMNKGSSDYRCVHDVFKLTLMDSVGLFHSVFQCCTLSYNKGDRITQIPWMCNVSVILLLFLLILC